VGPGDKLGRKKTVKAGSFAEGVGQKMVGRGRTGISLGRVWGGTYQTRENCWGGRTAKKEGG